MMLAAVLALLVGVTLGLLGGGGSILTVPIFAYVVGLEAKSAIATSLLVVGITSASGLVSHARAGRVHARIGGFFGLAGMGGAFFGSRLGHLLPGEVLLVAFAFVMLAASFMMMRGRRASARHERPRELPIAKILLIGSAVGLVAGLVGAGGGFLIVPALVLFGGLDMSEAVGTSLLVIAMQSLAGFLGHVGHVPIDWTLAGSFTGMAILGSLLGARLVRHVSPAQLRRVFAWFVLALAVYQLARQAPPDVAAWLAEHPAGWALVALALAALFALALAVQRSTNRPSSGPLQAPG